MNKEEKYREVYKIAESVIEKNGRAVSNMANLSAILMEHFSHHWIGFYLVDNSTNSLYLGPFQGPLACTEIPFGKGVCGTAWEQEKTQIVADVHTFPGHIACSALSNSEIVVPVLREGKVSAVLDIDSTEFNHFDEVDKQYLEKICDLL